MKLWLNLTSQKALESVAHNMPQSLLISGDYGVGLLSAAKYIANQQQVAPQIVLPEKDEKVDLEKGIISIDIMRRLYEETRTKSTAGRIIIIDYAERMTVQAQNAFLKLLEEPNAGTHFILLSHSASKLLPTITSRVESIDLRPISTEQSNDLLTNLGVSDATKRSKMLYIAGGLPAELSRLANDDLYLEKRSEIMRDAKIVLSGSLYQKLLLAHKYKDSRNDTLSLLVDSANILEKTVKANPEPSTIKHISKIMQTIDKIETNGSIRLALASMVI
jgi:DNA polymerase III subunit delta'